MPYIHPNDDRFLRAASLLALLTIAFIYIAPLVSFYQSGYLHSSSVPISHSQHTHHQHHSHDASLEQNWCDYCAFWAHLSADVPFNIAPIHCQLVLLHLIGKALPRARMSRRLTTHFARAPPVKQATLKAGESRHYSLLT